MKAIMAMLAMFLVHAAASGGTADVGSWAVDFSTTGEDVFWTSPDGVRADGAIYEVSFEIDSINVIVSYLGLEIGPLDVTDQLGANTVQEGAGDGPCPVDFGSNSVREPPEPDPVTIAFDVQLLIDAGGLAHYNMTSVELGTASYDIGWPIGEVTVSLEEVFIIGQFEVEVIGSDCVGDLDGSGTIGVDDLLAVIGAWGSCPGCPEDLNGDAVVGVDDLLAVIAGWGSCP